jgi:hypothetical protein
LAIENRRLTAIRGKVECGYLRSTTGVFCERSAEKHEAGDMTPEEGEEGGIWKWIGILAIAAGVMFLIFSIVAFITWCWTRRS